MFKLTSYILVCISLQSGPQVVGTFSSKAECEAHRQIHQARDIAQSGVAAGVYSCKNLTPGLSKGPSGALGILKIFGF